MRKFLSIVIPRYRETEKEVFPLLSSINGQLGVDPDDIEIIIANDGGGLGPLDDDFLALFDIEIRQVNLEENRGPGVARQRGLDVARGDYVMFCDADDTLHSVGVLGALIQEAVTNVPDIITSEWLEEIKNPQTGKLLYLPHQIENTWMHGKFLRRAFLQQNNIRFHDQLRVHEDSYLLSIAAAISSRNRHLAITSYVWKFRDDSITRRNEGIYTYEAFPTFVEACSMSHRELEQRGAANMEWKIIQFILYVYFSMQMKEWHDETHAKYLKESEETFAKWMVPFWHYWNDATPERRAEIYNQERSRSFNGRVERETIDSWAMRMIKLGMENNTIASSVKKEATSDNEA